MIALLRSEARRLVATGLTWWLLLGTVAIGIVGTAAPLLAADGTERWLTDAGLQEALHGAAAGVLLVLVAGIVAMAGDWRHGVATQTFLTAPRRRRVVAARSLALLGLGVAYGVAASASSLATAVAWYRAEGLTLPLDRSAVWLTLAGCVAVAASFGLLGVALGGIARNPVTGIVGAMGWMVMLEPAVFAAAPAVGRWLPGTASFAIRRQPADDLLPVGTAVLAVAAVTLVAAVVGTRLVERDDITA